MKICPICQAQNRDGAKYCQGCSAPLPLAAAASIPRAATPLGLALACPHCGAANKATAKFCCRCGQPMAPVALGGNIKTGKLLPAAMVGGRYLVKGILGQGGMGAVYLATDTRLGNLQCALKEMSDSALTDPAEKQEAQMAFLKEAQLLSQLWHPGLPRVTDSFSDGGQQFLVMDYVEGKPLDKVLENRKTPFSEAEVLLWAGQLCDVLHYLHTRPQPIIFRDMKPGNVMLSPDGKTVKLIDFGIARLFKPKATKDTTALGTPGYASPEQYGKTGQSDARSDVYGLGATLHHLLTLRDPGDEPFKFPPVRSLNPAVSEAVDKAIQKAVEKMPALRWSTAQEFKDALHAGQAVSAPAPLAPTPVGLRPTVVTPLTVTPPASPPPPPIYVPRVPPVVSLPGVLPFADNGPRAIASLIDGVVISVVFGVLFLGMTILFSGGSSNSTSGAMLLAALASMAFGVWYYTYFHSRSGQTPGKRAMHIKVVCQDGSPLSRERALWRASSYLGIALLGNIVCGLTSLIFLLPLVDRERRAPHDFLAGTRVISA